MNKKSTLEPVEIARIAAAAAQDKKASDIAILDLRGISTFTDFFVICSADSEPQTRAIVAAIEDTLREEHGVRPFAVDGSTVSQWLVMDYMQVTVHVFHKERRDYYALEDLWSDAPRLAMQA